MTRIKDIERLLADSLRVEYRSNQDVRAWVEEYRTSIVDNRLLVVPFASHDSAYFESDTGWYGEYAAFVASIKALLDAGALLAIEHPVVENTMRLLPDFVRYVDDHFPTAAGVVFVCDERVASLKPARLRPWWEAARQTCLSREIGALVVGNLPEGFATELPCMRRPADTTTPPMLAEVSMTGDVTDWGDALDEVLGRVGGLVRFANPSQLNLPQSLLERYCRESPRDAVRLKGSLPAHPKVLVNLGLIASGRAVADALVEACLVRLLALGTTPYVMCRVEAGADIPSGLKDVLERTGVRRLEPSGYRSVKQPGRFFDFSIVLTASAEVLFASWHLVGNEVQDGLVASLAEGIAQQSDCSERQVVERFLADSDVKVLTAGGGEELSLGDFLLADLWIVADDARNELVAGSDPLGLEAFVNEEWNLGAGATYLQVARRHSSPVTNLERLVIHRDPAKIPAEPPGAPFQITRKGPLYVLGLASTTLQNHAAALLRDGEIVAAVQEERLRRRKQTGWHPPGRPGVTVVADGSIPLEAAFPQRALAAVLNEEGITMDDVACVALNGIPAKFFHSYSLTERDRAPQTIADGKFMYVPHHLTHAASAFRVSGFEDGFVFTVDGRGERETAAFFEARDGRLHRVFDVLVGEDSLIGGVYEFITTILGFGHYGQGSTMGLAPFGKPTFDLSHWLSAQSRHSYQIHDTGILEAFGHLIRERNGPLEQVHYDLAASVQDALEETVLAFIEDGAGTRQIDNLCLAGGVALNCSMNQRIRQHFNVKNIYVQPAAHDAGTALGAALEAHWEITGEANPVEMKGAYWGPTYDEARVEDALTNYGVPYRREENISTRVGELIAGGSIVCWFQGRAEYGPRALGARSIMADPRSVSIRDRLNVLKGRQWWRPFGPSVLAGHESGYFEHAFHSPFMLFTFKVREERQDQIPAVVHVDGTTRPQSVTADVSPKYHAAIDAFYQKTGIPMVVNTSFNTAFEPIVESPEDAVSSFLQLGADYLAIGDYLVSRADIEAAG